MATDVVSQIDRQSENITELLAFIKKELDADAERHAALQAAAAAAGEVLQESQTGVTIDLSKTNIKTLPLEAIALMKDRVERLAISHNPHVAIPTEIAQCERLRYLNLRRDQLTEFPKAVLQLSKLEILDLSRNKLTVLPEDIKKLTSLKFLALANNRLTRLPFALGEMSSLGKLKFDENPIEYPPIEAYRLSPDHAAHETEREQVICQRVKRFLRAAAVKEKLKAVSEDNMSEDQVETPRPPKRSFTAGRFPIRPSVSGVDSALEARADSPSDSPMIPPIPQKSHARVESTNASAIKRPGVTPLLANGNDSGRSRSDTASSLRQRRQGYVPTRQANRDLASVSEDAARLGQASASKPTHTRATSSISTVNSNITPNSGDTSGAVSPVDGRLEMFRKKNNLSDSQNLKTNNSPAFKFSFRMVQTLSQLGTPIMSVIAGMGESAPHTSSIGRQLVTAQTHVKNLDQLMKHLGSGPEANTRSERETTALIVSAAANTLKSYAGLVSELNRRTARAAQLAEGCHLRTLMLHIYGTLIEVRNACLVLGAKVNEGATNQDKSRVSRAWSSKSVTPTQPKAPSNRRMPRPPMLQSVSSTPMPRVTAPRQVAMPPSLNRAHTTTVPSSVATARVVDSYVSAAATNMTLSRTNTTRTYLDDGEGDEQFDRIFLKLQTACHVASQALPHCRKEFQARKAAAQHAEQRSLAQQWSVLIGRSEEVISHNRALKKQLEVVKVNDPGLRHQRDFWQLCDAFVRSWTEFASEVRELGQQRVEISSIKHAMRNVQHHVKDVSKSISSSPLYHHALGGSNKSLDSSIPTALASPFVSSGWNAPYPQHDAARVQNGYVTSPIPATPLSAALGPAVHATVATPNTTTIPREYFPEPPTARQVRDRNDTPMQQPSYARRH